MTLNNLSKIGLLILISLWTAYSGFAFDERRGVSGVEIRLGVGADGKPSDEWLAALETRLPPDRFAKIKAHKKPLGEPERRWLKLLESTARAWSARRGQLQIPFGKTKAPENLTILAGNQGGDDGFTYLENIICIELAALAENYGDAESEENKARVSRILDHEYTHLLHHEWFRRNPPDLSTPMARALRDLIAEGIGNYRSLSARWIDRTGALTEQAKATLKELEPVFVERLTKLRRARTPAQEDALRQGLSRGQFNKKWGALTIALWLARETKGDERNLIKWVRRGPRGVVRLARKYLPDKLKKEFLK